MDRKIIDPKTADWEREVESIRKRNADEWKRQTILNNAMSKGDLEDVLEAVWVDPRRLGEEKDISNPRDQKEDLLTEQGQSSNVSDRFTLRQAQDQTSFADEDTYGGDPAVADRNNLESNLGCEEETGPECTIGKLGEEMSL
jgi:hypothetical protein